MVWKSVTDILQECGLSRHVHNAPMEKQRLEELLSNRNNEETSLDFPQRCVDRIQCSTNMTNKKLNRSQASYQLFLSMIIQAKASQLLGFTEKILKTLHKLLKKKKFD